MWLIKCISLAVFTFFIGVLFSANIFAEMSRDSQNISLPIEVIASVTSGSSNLKIPIKVTKNEQFAVITSGNGAELWDIDKDRLVRTFRGLKMTADSIDISDDNSRIVAAGEGGEIIIWDILTGKVIAKPKTGMGEINGVAFTKDGNHLVYSGNRIGIEGSIVVQKISNDEVIRSTSIRTSSLSVGDISARRDVFAGGLVSGAIRIVELDGKKSRLLRAHSRCKSESCSVVALCFSPDSRLLASSAYDATVRIWDVATGKLIRTFDASGGAAPAGMAISWSPDGEHLIYANSAGAIKRVDLNTGRIISQYVDRTNHGAVFGINYLPKNDRLLASIKGLSILDGRSLELLKHISNVQLPIALTNNPMGFGDNIEVTAGQGRSIITMGLREARIIKRSYGQKDELWFDVHTLNNGKALLGRGVTRSLTNFSSIVVADKKKLGSTRPLIEDLKFLAKMALSSSGNIGFAFSINKGGFVFDVVTGKLRRKLINYRNTPGNLVGYVDHSALSPDGTTLVTHDLNGSLIIWDVATGRRKATKEIYTVNSLKFLPHGQSFLVGGTSFDDYVVEHRSTSRGRLIQKYKISPGNGIVTDLAIDRTGQMFLSAGHDASVKLWNISNGQLIHNLKGHSSPIDSVAFALNGKRIISTARDGLKIWDTGSGQLLLTYIVVSENDWVAITPEGFFDTSGNGSRTLSLVKGIELYDIEQVFRHLYRPDLIKALLAGDQEGRYRDAAHKLNLEVILESGPAPQIDHLAQKDERTDETVRLNIRLTARGGGIGNRLVWKVNGVTQGNPNPPELVNLKSPIASISIAETLKIISGQSNEVEVIAYNKAGLVASQPLKIYVDKFGSSTEEPAKMYVIAMGVDNYRMKQYQLSYAAHDARTFSKSIVKVGSKIFSEVITTTLTNDQVNQKSISEAFDTVARQAGPNDVLIIFLGGHGKSIAGRYFYYPQTLDFSKGQTVEKSGIGQDQWEAWLAKIPVLKSLLIIDTCEGDAFRGSRGANAAHATAIMQLQHATGRNIISASRDAAYEGYKGHGVLTYAILEALDSNNVNSDDPRISVSALADHVGVRVPEISLKNFGIYQNPTRKLAGNDFPIGIRQSILSEIELAPEISKDATHVVVRNELVRSKPSNDAPGNQTLIPGTQVRAIEFVGDWVVVARGGQKIGYIQVDAIARLQ